MEINSFRYNYVNFLLSFVACSVIRTIQNRTNKTSSSYIHLRRASLIYTHATSTLQFDSFIMFAPKILSTDTKSLPSNVLDLRDEAFYDFVRQHSGKRVAELLAFQECNGVDSLLACPDVTAILRLQSEQLNDLKKTMCITLTDGTIVLLPGLEFSINNLIKLLTKKRDEVNKHAQRIQSITSVLSKSSEYTSIHETSSLNSPKSDTPDSLPSVNCLINDIPLNSELLNKISTSISDWLKRNREEFKLSNTDFQPGTDFQIELNKQRDGIIIKCKCKVKLTISQKRGILMVRDLTI